MRLILLFIASLLQVYNISAQEVKLSLITQNSWPPGEFVPVRVEIMKGDLEGFARFYQDLPQGFTVKAAASAGADFYRDNSQVNFVWVKLPAEKTFTITYLVKADQSLSGSFRLGGDFDYVIGGKERKRASLSQKLIKLDRNAKLAEDAGSLLAEIEKQDENISLAEEEKEEKEEKEENLATDTRTKERSVRVQFRVQVAVSSMQLSKTELENRIGCELNRDLTVLKSGNIYKYQSGSFRTYNLASEYLSRLKECGVVDSFIVAYRNSEQISVELARTLTE